MVKNKSRDHSLISTWLMIGVIMIFIQILLGGITRLTGSGLSITRWEIVTGTLPPLNDRQWEDAFILYQETPQYKRINEGMDLTRFKFIFFWEYIHRLWARSMGFIFLFPFLYFLFRGSLYPVLLKRLGVVISLAALAALFGWIMVASGLKDRPWVDAYKLTVHLGLGVSLFVFMFLTWLKHKGLATHHSDKRLHVSLKLIIALAIIQFAFGGVMSGMKASIAFPTWPLMNGSYLPQILTEGQNWNTDNFLLYDKSGFMPALVQFVHRNLAYLLLVLITLFSVRFYKSSPSALSWISWSLVGIIVVQASLGIITLLNSVGGIPLLYGVLHQGVAILLLTLLFYIREIISPV
jgi:cytochrome c oxidase assembly protein subunit 15